MKICLIEDDDALRSALKTRLESACFNVDTAADGEQGSFMARINGYDLIVVDGMLPSRHGRDVCQDIRLAGKKTPILMLSVQSDVKDKVEGLNMGADDYLTKPFSFDELMARIRALLRRPGELMEDVLRVRDIALDARRQKVTWGEKDVHLTRKEFMLFECLLRRKGSVVSRGELLEHVWDSTVDPFSNTIESHVLSLRRKLGHTRKAPLIHTVSGRGYKIDESIS